VSGLDGADGRAYIRLDDVRRAFGAAEGVVRALAGITFSIEAGSSVAITGPSGSGKSTLLHVLAAIEPVDSGRVQVGEREVSALSPRELVRYRREVGLVFQRFHLIPALTALDNVLVPVLPLRTSFDAPARGRELLARVGLSGRERSLPSRMSGGQQQRIAIARALINHPSILLADEPTGSLDSVNGEAVIDLLLELRAELGMTVVIATHDPNVSARCEREIRLIDGRVAA
jgi:putative ABC transport system ATP-binding protein